MLKGSNIALSISRSFCRLRPVPSSNCGPNVLHEEAIDAYQEIKFLEPGCGSSVQSMDRKTHRKFTF